MTNNAGSPNCATGLYNTGRRSNLRSVLSRRCTRMYCTGRGGAGPCVQRGGETLD